MKWNKIHLLLKIQKRNTYAQACQLEAIKGDNEISVGLLKEAPLIDINNYKKCKKR